MANHRPVKNMAQVVMLCQEVGHENGRVFFLKSEAQRDMKVVSLDFKRESAVVNHLSHKIEEVIPFSEFSESFGALVAEGKLFFNA